jgi:acetyl esterase/lipase
MSCMKSIIKTNALAVVGVLFIGAALCFSQGQAPGGVAPGKEGASGVGGSGGGPGGSWPSGVRPPEPPPLDVSSYANKTLDVVYADKSQKQKLDIYLPTIGKGPFPVVVYLHGGGWEVSDKRSTEIEIVLKSCLSHGYALVSVNYRPASEALFPAQIKDVKAAIRWLRANGKQYGLNTVKIGAWGSSAGGHLAALLGTTGSVKEFDDASLGNPSESSRVQAVIGVSGPINFLTMDDQLEKAGFKGFAKHSQTSGPESNLVGKSVVEVPDRVKAANPETYVGKDAAPMLLEYGAKDDSVPVQQATDLAAKLQTATGKDNVSVVVFPEGGHGGGEAFSSQQNMNTIFSFLDKYIK